MWHCSFRRLGAECNEQIVLADLFGDHSRMGAVTVSIRVAGKPGERKDLAGV
jgi:hypothetical protein